MKESDKLENISMRAKRVDGGIYMTRQGFEKYQFNYTRITGAEDVADVNALIPEFFKDVVLEIDRNTEHKLNGREDKWHILPAVELGMNYLVKPKFMRSSSVGIGGLVNHCDEHMDYLKFNDDIVAMVTNTRDVGNYHRFNFSENIDAAVLGYQMRKEFWDKIERNNQL